MVNICKNLDCKKLSMLFISLFFIVSFFIKPYHASAGTHSIPSSGGTINAYDGDTINGGNITSGNVTINVSGKVYLVGTINVSNGKTLTITGGGNLIHAETIACNEAKITSNSSKFNNNRLSGLILHGSSEAYLRGDTKVQNNIENGVFSGGSSHLYLYDNTTFTGNGNGDGTGHDIFINRNETTYAAVFEWRFSAKENMIQE